MKTVKEIHLSLKNQPGALFGVTDLLGTNGVHMVAFCVSMEGKKGTLRFVADDPEKAIAVLQTGGYTAEVNEVLACEIPQHPNGLSAVLKPLQSAKINVDTIYPWIGIGDATVLILALKPIPEALKILEDNWIRVLGEELYQM